MRFDGSSGGKPSAEARRYVYAVMASAIETDLREEGWILGGIEDEVDRRRVRKEALKVRDELRKKACR